jgi:4'-phosphopantetheinyl transferase EntD
MQEIEISESLHVSALRGVCPPGWVVAGGPALNDAFLYSEEAAAVATALDSRKKHFSSGRHYAREALAQLGIHAGAVPSNPDRSPRWPVGIVGSITHAGDLVCAVVGWQSEYAGLGIDAESRVRTLSNGIDRLIRTGNERDQQALLCAPDHVDIVRLVFSAKESIHKCVAPQCGITLGFHDLELDLDFARGSFTARLLRDDPRIPDFRKLHGRFEHTNDFVLTAAWMAV